MQPLNEGVIYMTKPHTKSDSNPRAAQVLSHLIRGSPLRVIVPRLVVDVLQGLEGTVSGKSLTSVARRCAYLRVPRHEDVSLRNTGYDY